MIKDGDYVKQSGVATNLSNTTPQLGAGAYYFSTKETSMSNGRPDAWSTIPVSVLVGAQLRNNVEDSNTVEPYKAGGKINASLTERDYIGLSDASLAVQASSQRENSSNAKAYDLECKDVELRLGIGPCNGGVSSADAAQDAGWLGGSRFGCESHADSSKAALEGSLSSSKSGKSALTEQANSRNEQFFPHSAAQVSFQGWAGEQQQQQPSLGKYVLYKGYPSGAQVDGVAQNMAAVAAAPQQQQRNDLSPLHHAKPALTVAPAGDHHLQSAASPSPTIQNFWHQAFRVNLSNDPSGGEAGCYNNYTWGPGLAPGRFVIPVPKVSTVPAKRPYLEAIGDNRAPNSCNTTSTNGGNIGGSACSLNTPADAAQLHSNPSCSSATPAAAAAGGGGGGGGMYTWSANAVQIPGGWQHMSFDQGNNVGGFGKSSLPIVLPPPTPPHFKVPPAPISHNQPPLDSTGSEPSSSSKGEGVLKSDSQNDDSRNKAPVVGWPPVRSFRKNTLQATHGYKMSSEDRQETAGPGGSEASEQSNSNKNAFYVKAKLDGVRICRKVDLKSYDSYDSLKSALQEMFQGFVNDNAKLDLLHGNNYVLTHEDKDGDCLLVGDVPWHMFVASTVKSFRIMKAADATGIGEKVSAKLKAQTNCKP